MEQKKLTAAESQVFEALTGRFGEKITGHSSHCDQFSIQASADIIVELAEFMRDDKATDFRLLADITAVDWIDDSERRFEIIYTFYSIPKCLRTLVRVRIPDGDTPLIDSLCSIYTGADWLEREVYDLFGIEFENHSDLRRIITPEDIEGWPLRKDFPLTYEAPHFSHNKDLPPEIIK